MSDQSPILVDMENPMEESLEDLERTRAGILQKIFAIQNSFPDDAHVYEETYSLRDQFNYLSGRIKSIQSLSPSIIWPDPLEKLPLEIWTIVMREVSHMAGARALLELTSVSETWFKKLTGNQLLWGAFSLDHEEADSAATAWTCICLAKASQLSISMLLTLEQLLEVAPWITEYAPRIKWISVRENDGVPILKHLLPYLSNVREIHTAVPTIPDEEMEPWMTLDLGRMPSLELIMTQIPIPDPKSPWLRFIDSLRRNEGYVTDEEYRAWRQAPKLRTVRIFEYKTVNYDPDHDLLAPSASLKKLLYHGPNLARVLSWIGPSLVHLSINCDGVRQLGETCRALTAARYFRSLEVALRYDLNSRDTSSQSEVYLPDEALEVSTLNLARLKIRFKNSKVDVKDIPRYVRWTTPIYNYLAMFFRRIQLLCVDILVLTLDLVEFINGFTDLLSLELVHANVAPHAHSFALKGPKSLRSIKLSDIWLLMGNQFLSKFTTHEVFTTAEFKPRTEPWSQDQPFLPTKVLATPREDHPGHLAISPTLERTDSFFSMTWLRLGGRRGEYNVYLTNVCEEIALQPALLPSLTSLTLNELCIEWDILILMLERRNLLSQVGVQPIRHLSVLEWGIGKPLRAVLVALLASRYPIRDVISSYSLEAICDRIVDSKRSGCLKCCFLMKECYFPVSYGYKSPTVGGAKLRWPEEGYEFPHEHKKPDPSLTLRDTHWFSGRRKRYRDYLRRYEAWRAGANRYDSCDFSPTDEWTELDASEYLDPFSRA